MKRHIFLYLVTVLLLVASRATAQTPKVRLSAPVASPRYTPEAGFVPDANTAIMIAEAVWLPIYGKAVLTKKPFEARLIDGGVWVVEGSLPKGMEGGVPYIEISKLDGRILEVTHGK